MVAMYNIAGRQIGSHYLAIATLTALFAGSYSMAGGSKKPAQQAPPINAGSKDEEAFIQEFLKSAEEESKKTDAKH